MSDLQQPQAMRWRGLDGNTLHGLRLVAAAPLADVLIVPGYADHAARYSEVMQHLAGHHISCLAVSLRGHGESSGARGYVRSFAEYRADIASALGRLSGAPRFILAHSNGALAALGWLGDLQAAPAPAPLRGLIVTNPFLALAMPVPWVKRQLGRVAAVVAPRLSLPSGIDPQGLSRDAAVGAAYAQDALVFKTATAGWFAAATAEQQRVRGLRSLPLPVLYVYGDADPIAAPSANAALAQALDLADKTVVVRRGGRHEVLNEIDRHELYALVSDWIAARAATP